MFFGMDQEDNIREQSTKEIIGRGGLAGKARERS
jgi:hypothetical protein